MSTMVNDIVIREITQAAGETESLEGLEAILLVLRKLQDVSGLLTNPAKCDAAERRILQKIEAAKNAK